MRALNLFLAGLSGACFVELAYSSHFVPAFLGVLFGILSAVLPDEWP